MPEFGPTLLPDLRKKQTFRATFYTAKVAARHARVGHSVRFVPQSREQNRKIPDIRVESQEGFAWIECKWREKFDPNVIPYDEMRRMKIDALHAANEGLTRNVEYTVFSFAAPTLETYTEAARWARQVIEQGRSGKVVSQSADLMVYIEEIPIKKFGPVSPDLRELGPIIKKMPDIYLKHDVEPKGRERRLSHLSLGNIICIDGDRFKSFKNEISETRGKWPREDCGILYVDVARKWGSVSGSSSYLALLGDFIHDWVWRKIEGGFTNTRIKAISLTGDCPIVPAPFPDGSIYNRISTNYLHIYQPGSNYSPMSNATAVSLLNKALSLKFGKT